MENNLSEGDVVLCTVDKIVGTTVFVKIENNGEGTIVTSEIAPGRIRNLRDYVVPNKKIVCKVLRTDKLGRVDLTLRRVTAKEKKEVMELYQKEKGLIATLKKIFENSEGIIEKIKKEFSITEFFEKAKQDAKILEKFIPKESIERILKILNEKKEKDVIVKKEFNLSSKSENGLSILKSILPEQTTYIGAGKFLLTIKDKNYKDANQKASAILEDIEKKAKEQSCEFSVKKWIALLWTKHL